MQFVLANLVATSLLLINRHIVKALVYLCLTWVPIDLEVLIFLSPKKFAYLPLGTYLVI